MRTAYNYGYELLMKFSSLEEGLVVFAVVFEIRWEMNFASVMCCSYRKWTGFLFEMNGFMFAMLSDIEI